MANNTLLKGSIANHVLFMPDAISMRALLGSKKHKQNFPHTLHVDNWMLRSLSGAMPTNSANVLKASNTMTRLVVDRSTVAISTPRLHQV